MKRNELVEIKKMEIKAIHDRVGLVRVELAGLVIDKNIGKLKDLRSIRNKRKDLSQMLTILRQKELLIQMEAQNVSK